MSTRRERWYRCTLISGEGRFSAFLRAWSADEAVAEFQAGLGPEWSQEGVVAVAEGAGPAAGPADLGAHEGAP